MVASEIWAHSWKLHWAIVLFKSESVVNSSHGWVNAHWSGSQEAWAQILSQLRDLREVAKPP